MPAQRRLAQHRHPLHARRNLLEQLQPFGGDAVLEHNKASGVAARPREAGDQARTDRVDGAHEGDRNGPAHLSQHHYNRRRRGHDDVWRERQQVRGVFPHAVGIEVVSTPAIVYPHVAADGPAQLLQTLQKRRVAALSFRIVGG